MTKARHNDIPAGCKLEEPSAEALQSTTRGGRPSLYVPAARWCQFHPGIWLLVKESPSDHKASSQIGAIRQRLTLHNITDVEVVRDGSKIFMRANQE